jgi:hypothetical protein
MKLTWPSFVACFQRERRPRTAQRVAARAMTQHAILDAAALAEMKLRAELAEQRVTFLKDQLEDVKVDRDHWRTQAEAQQRLLADATAKAQRPWWRRLAG